jgi:hypothetical protein
MSLGQKDREARILAYPHVLRVKKRGLSILEALVVSFLMVVVFMALFLSLSTGEFSFSVSIAKADLQAKVRRVMDWIVKDVRQTNLIQINNNDPSINHIRFKKVTGIDNSIGNYTLSSDYVDYDYDSMSGNLTRSEINEVGTTLKSWIFSNITQSPFYTAQGVPLAPGGILTNKKLIIVISAQNQARGSLILDQTLTEEVKIRNE